MWNGFLVGRFLIRETSWEPKMFLNIVWMHMGTNSFFMEIYTRGLQKAFITHSNLHDTSALVCESNGN